MRFFAHDGKAVHGPSALEELLKLPGFDGDTLVCPVGSEDSADWKPALAYPPIREALLAPAPKPAPLPTPPPPPPPLPPPPAPTQACPRCAHANPEGARYCNACAAPMDGREPIAASAPAAPESIAPESVAPEPVVPAPQPVARSAGMSKPMAGAFIGALIASGTLGYWLLRPHAAPPPIVIPPPPAAAPAPAEPAAAPVVVPAVAPADSPKPIPPAAPVAAPKEPAPKKPAPAAKRAARKPRAKKPAPAPKAEAQADNKEETLIESRAPAPAPAPEPAAPLAPPAQEDRGFLLPGVPRRVPPQSAVKAKAAASPAAADAAPAANAAAEDGTTRQVREQFEFCAQLLTQGAYADHFDTCLCAEARQSAPYRGRRGYYATALRKAAAAGGLETSASVTGIVLDGAVAKVTAKWKTGGSTRTRAVTQSWQLEEGLWCRNP